MARRVIESRSVDRSRESGVHIARIRRTIGRIVEAERTRQRVRKTKTKKIMGTINTRLYLDLVIVIITYVLLVKTIIVY